MFVLMACATLLHILQATVSCLILVSTSLFLFVQLLIGTSTEGPKMYNAHGNLHNDFHGSTRLHLDVTSAINILLYASHLPDGTSGYAVWHIFPPTTTHVLRDFLRNESSINFSGSSDPIHRQTIYLTPSLLQLLFEKHGIRPYAIHQHAGDAIFIPAGCAHQVSPSFPLQFAPVMMWEL
jgi:hypothetical protein